MTSVVQKLKKIKQKDYRAQHGVRPLTEVFAVNALLSYTQLSQVCGVAVSERERREERGERREERGREREICSYGIK